MSVGGLLAAAAVFAVTLWLATGWYGRWSNRWVEHAGTPVPGLYANTFGCAFYVLLLLTFGSCILAVVKVVRG